MGLRRSVFVLLACVRLFAQPGTVAVSNIRADAISHSSLRLLWDNSTTINAVRVRYGTSTSYESGPGGAIFTPGTSGFAQTGQTVSLSGLLPGAQYHFCPQGSADGGKTWSACVDFAATLGELPDPHPARPVAPVEFDVSYPVQSGASLMASAGCSNLQELLNQARYGDTILLPAGANCSGPYRLPMAPEAVTFQPKDVDASSDQITLRSHPFPDGQTVHLDADQCLPGSAGEDIFCQGRGILPGADYLVQRVDGDHIRLRKPDGTPVTFSVSAFTADPATRTLTISPQDQLLYNGAAIQVRSTEALPGGLQPQQTYYVINPSRSRTISLSLSPGGTPIDITSSGQGNHFFADPGRGLSAILAWPPENKWIVVRTATPDEEFCPEGVRCLGAIWAPKMARIAQTTAPTGNPADLRLVAGLLSHHWRFTGIEFTHADNSAEAATTSDPTAYYGFISTRRSVSNLILDRCYIHGLGAPNRIYRAIETFDGTNMAIINSDLEQLDFWHPSVSPGGLLPTITSPQTVQIAPGSLSMGIAKAAVDAPVTITLTSGSGSGRAVVYFDLNSVLHVDLPTGVQGTCNGKNCVISTASISDPWYPNNNSGRISVVQVTDLAITNGAFTSVAYRASYSQASRLEGAQSFIAGHGPGPFLIQNNTISGTGIPIHFDDSGATEDRHDYVVRRNLFTAPLSQQGGGASSDGLHYFHRNHLEWKGGQRILVEGNVFEHNFADVAPLGAPLVFTARSGGYITDVMIRNNTFRHNAGGIILAAVDSYNPVSKPMERVAIENNLFHDNDGYLYSATDSRAAATGILLYYGYAAADLRVDHNTVYDNRGYDPEFLHLVLNPLEGVSITNNFLWVNDDANRKGIGGEGYSNCPGSSGDLLDCALVSGGRPNYTFSRNILMPGWRISSPTELLSSASPRLLAPTVLRDAYTRQSDNWVIDGSSIPERLAQAGMGAANNGFRLTGESLYSANGSRTGTDRKAIGADLDQLEVAQGTIGDMGAGFDDAGVFINVRVPDEGAACYVLYGQGKDISRFARTPADTSLGRIRTIRLGTLLPQTAYNYVVLCSGASNIRAESFTSGSAAVLQ